MTASWRYEEAERLLELAVAALPDRAVYVSNLALCIGVYQKDQERALQWYAR